MNTAYYKYDKNTNKHMIIFNNQVVAKSSNSEEWIKRYVGPKGNCSKTRGLNITNFIDIEHSESTVIHFQEDETPLNVIEVKKSTPIIEVTKHFSAKEKFSFLKDYAKMVGQRAINSLIVSGDPGLGKTYETNLALSEIGMCQITPSFCSNDEATFDEEFANYIEDKRNHNSYVSVKGFSTPKALYRTLYENRDKVIIFDDCDAVLDNAVAVNLLKAALDCYDKRVITWNSEQFGSDLPRSFIFHGGVIFITNKKPEDIDEAIKSRSICVDVFLSDSQKIDRMLEIVTESEDFENYVDDDIKIKAVEFLDKNKSKIKDLNMRTLQILVKTINASPNGWEPRAEYVLFKK